MTPDNQPAPLPTLSVDKRLDILNDHYKDTFTRLREHEQSRDRLFLWTMALYTLLILEIGYPAALGGALGKIALPGVGDLNLQALPLPALLNASWLVTLVVILQYCQTVVRVNRQYPYLYKLEDTISPELGGGDIFQREGNVYLRQYPILLDVAGAAYGLIFPVIAILSTLGLLIWEWTQLPYDWLHKVVDLLLALGILIVLISYRIQPTLAQRWARWQTTEQAAFKELIEGDPRQT